MKENIYIHYGHKAFDPALFNKPTNEYLFNKPHGGLWASRIDAAFGWKEWTEREEFCSCSEDNSFRFSLSKDAKVYHIYCKKDVEAMPLQIRQGHYTLTPDFEKTLEMGYDAVEYHLSEEIEPENEYDGLYWVLYGWDCDSIVVLNPAIVVPIST